MRNSFIIKDHLPATRNVIPFLEKNALRHTFRTKYVYYNYRWCVFLQQVNTTFKYLCICFDWSVSCFHFYYDICTRITSFLHGIKRFWIILSCFNVNYSGSVNWYQRSKSKKIECIACYIWTVTYLYVVLFHTL
jgi:hypothetical protein